MRHPGQHCRLELLNARDGCFMAPYLVCPNYHERKPITKFWKKKLKFPQDRQRVSYISGPGSDLKQGTRLTNGLNSWMVVGW